MWGEKKDPKQIQSNPYGVQLSEALSVYVTFFSIIVAPASPDPLDSLSPKFRDTSILALDSFCLHRGSRQKDKVIILVISFVFLISRTRAAFLSSV